MVSWVFKIRKIIANYDDDTQEELDKVQTSGKTHFMASILRNYPKDKDDHLLLRQQWKDSMKYDDMLKITLSYSQRLQTLADELYQNGHGSMKRIAKSNQPTVDEMKDTDEYIMKKLRWKDSTNDNSKNSNRNQGYEKKRFDKRKNVSEKAPANKVRKTGEIIRHKGCGLPHSLTEECLFKKLDHKYYNHEDVEFKDSTKGKEWFKLTGKYTLSKVNELNSLTVNTVINNDHHTPSFTLEIGEKTIPAKVLIDTGCFARSYISEEFYNKIKDESYIKLHIEIPFSVCSCINVCVTCNSYIILKLRYQDEINNFILEIKFYIIASNIPLIIGHPEFVKHELGVKCKTFIANMHHQFVSLNAMHEQIDEVQTQETQRLYVPKEQFLDAEDEGEDLDDPIPWKNFLELQLGDNDLPEDSQIAGDSTMRSRTKDILIKNARAFSRSLPAIPAKVTPMQLKVDISKWKVNKNMIRPRPLSIERERQSRLQIEELRKINVIEDSRAAYCSAVHMVPKPHSTELRFTVDFRNLNDATEAERLHIPNIKSMIQEIGQTRPQYFAKLDLTKGYYQIPLHKDSREFTAFTSHSGTFQWNRVPMGLKGAAGWFQKMLTTECLKELVNSGKILLYIDDLIISGSTLTEYYDNLDQVLARLIEYGFVVHPGKCQFNVNEIEYVGHSISAKGVRFSKEKIAPLVAFKKPTSHKEMKSFLGLANWFRDHVRDYSDLTRELHEGIKDYHRKKSYLWTAKRSEDFNKLKQRISESQMLFFPDKDWPIHLHTDASDFGIGAFLFQEKSGQTRPIAFMSQKLTATQQRWSTAEKECFAIVQALHKFDYLLSDVTFSLKTDHRNLTFLNQGLSSKVLRWKLMIQKYDFKLEYIPGETNIQADAFSRADFNHLTILNDYHIQSMMQRYNVASLTTGRTLLEDIPSDILHLLESCHNDFQGHHGVERTKTYILSRIKELKQSNVQLTIDTNNLNSYCRLFINRCTKCQLFQQIKPIIQAKRYTCASYQPMKDLAIDAIGPFPMDSAGNKHVLVIIDTFSRWIHLTPVTDVSAVSAAKQIISFLGIFGTPENLRHDSGTEFLNELWDILLKTAGIKQTVNHPYSKEENGIVERANKEITKHLRNLLFGNPDIKNNWSLVIPLVQRIYNNAPNSSIGNIRPCQIIFGNAINLNGPIIDSDQFLQGKIDNINRVEYKQYLTILLTNQRIIIEEAQRAQLIKDNLHLNKDVKQNRTTFVEGTYVLVDRYPPHTDWSKKSKLQTRWLGPYLITKRNEDWYTLRNLVTSNEETYHVTQIKIFNYDKNKVDPVKLAFKQNDEYIVDAIISHEGNLTKLDEVKFRVRWKDFTALDDTMEPWSNLKQNSKLHEYLIQIGQQKVIPYEFRSAYPETFNKTKQTKNKSLSKKG